MNTVKIVTCCLLVIPLAGPARKSARTPSERSSVQEKLRSASLQRGVDLFRLGRYQEASATFQSVLDSSQSPELEKFAGRAVGNLGACQLALHQYRAALQLFLEAHRRLKNAGDTSGAAVFNANIASVYIQMGEYAAAAEWVERSMTQLTGRDRERNLAPLQIQLATLRSRQDRMAEAMDLFRLSLNAVDRSGNLELYATAWSRLGEESLRRADLAQAERAFLEAYYVRKLHHLRLDYSYGNLGLLRLAQGDFESAAVMLDQAIESAARPGGVPAWEVYDARGRVRLAQGRLRPALEDLQVALRLARVWRASAPADDTTRLGAESKLDQLHSAFVEAGNRLYLETRDPALLGETFRAEEENRAASLRALLNQPRAERPDLPPAYWDAVERLRRAEIAELRQPGAGGVEAALAELIRMEASLGPELRPVPSRLVEACRRRLDRESVILSFHLGPSASWLWALDRAGLTLYTLPPQTVIEARGRAAVTAIRDNRPDADERSAELYKTLFAPLEARFQRAPHWLLALDESLFDVPIAALVVSSSPKRVYVAERHTVEVIPGAAYWLDAEARAEERVAALFVGVGDPIYNQADPRLAGPRGSGRGPLALPRLVGSGSEIEACSRAWGGPAVLLRGSEASREKVAAQLRRRPAAVHMAAHYLESAERPGYGLIALSLSPRGEPELLTPFEISRWRIEAGLVVLSGCHSAAGTPLPATGLQGLTRAWLAGGAHSVVATLWETPDDDGTLFRSLYQNLRNGGRLDAARALRNAQVDMIRSGGRRSNPRYWGAYFIVGGAGRTVLES